MPPILDYESLVPVPPSTRASFGSACPCSICNIARLKNEEYKEFSSNQSNPVGAPATLSKPDKAQAMTVCLACLSEIAPGKSHYCVKSTRRENISELIRSSSDKSKSSRFGSGKMCSSSEISMLSMAL